MVDREFMEELMAKFLSGNCTEEEKEKLISWRNENEENEKEFLAFKMAWDLVDKPGSYNREKAWKKVSEKLEFEPDGKVVPLYQKSWFRVAATVVLIMSIALILRNNFWVRSENQITYSTAELLEEYVLEDKTSVTLRKGAELKFDEDFGENSRDVSLKGTAFFDVERDEEKPFRVLTDFGTVEVLGTSFLVETDTIREITLVHVESGRVLVFPDNDPLKGVEITINEGAEVSPGQVRKIQVGNTNIIAWKSKKIRYKQESLVKVFTELGDIYGKEMEFEEEDFLECTFTGKFSELPLKTILDQLKEIYGFDYVISGDTISISGNGC